MKVDIAGRGFTSPGWVTYWRPSWADPYYYYCLRANGRQETCAASEEKETARDGGARETLKRDEAMPKRDEVKVNGEVTASAF
jgi:hypothetical protein